MVMATLPHTLNIFFTRVMSLRQVVFSSDDESTSRHRKLLNAQGYCLVIMLCMYLLLSRVAPTLAAQ